jgi:glycosyltransferase involved in cell wall biosynthesis
VYGFAFGLKILLVTHGFPPHQTAGTEGYTADLGVELVRRGHVVRVFTAHKDIGQPDYRVIGREWESLLVFELTNNLFHDDFVETYANPRVEREFEALVAEFRPDVVHVQHLLYLSTGCIRAAKAAGASVVFTLHDFWLQCPRLGQRVHADGGVCDTIDFERCGTCLARYKWKNSRLERTVGGIIATLRTGTGIDLAPLARATRKRLHDAPPAPPARTEDADARLMADAARERTARIQRDVVPAVDLFVAPSRFLRGRFVTEWNLAPERIEHVRFGIDRHVVRRPRAPGAPLRVAFVGSLVPLKGAHVLVAAWARLDAAQRRKGELVLYGPARHHPEYQAELARAASQCGAQLGGVLEREQVAVVLAGTDLLVVPSLWFENAPLVILEALATRTPLLVSDLGGMAELVEPGVHGYRFRMGDAADLADKLAAALDGTLPLDTLYARPLAIPTFAQHVDVLVAHYGRLRASARP